MLKHWAWMWVGFGITGLSSINDLDLASIGWKVKENGENSNWSENRGENKDIKPSKYGTKHSKMRLLLLNSNEYPGNWERSYRRDLKNEGTDKNSSDCIWMHRVKEKVGGVAIYGSEFDWARIYNAYQPVGIQATNTSTPGRVHKPHLENAKWTSFWWYYYLSHGVFFLVWPMFAPQFLTYLA